MTQHSLPSLPVPRTCQKRAESPVEVERGSDGVVRRCGKGRCGQGSDEVEREVVMGLGGCVCCEGSDKVV